MYILVYTAQQWNQRFGKQNSSIPSAIKLCKCGTAISIKDSKIKPITFECL